MRNATYERPPLKSYQLYAFFHDKREGWVEGTTKCGKTVTGMAWLTEQALVGSPYTNHWWVAPVYAQARIAYDRTKAGLPPKMYRPNDSDMTLTLINKHVMWYKSAEKPDNLYGEDVGSMVLDECTRMRVQAWWAARTTLTKTKGKVRGVANIKGRKNWHYNLCRMAEQEMALKGPLAECHYAKILSKDAVEAGVLDAKDVEDAKRVLPEAIFNELYMGVPSDDGGNPFGIGHIAACVKEISEYPAVCYGVDLGKHVDPTVIIGLDHLGMVCFFEQFLKPWMEAKETIRRVCGAVPTLVDATGVGDPVLEDLQRGKGYGGNFEGYVFHVKSKQQLMEGLANGIQERATSVLEGPHRAEMESFEFEYTRTGVRYSAPEGMHDDCVCAHALAWQHWKSKASKHPASQWGASEAASEQEAQPEWA